MNLITTPPPIYPRVREKLGIDFVRDGIIMTYYPNVHVATGNLPRDLVEHEGIHLNQQSNFPGGVEAWWEKYLADPQWRLEQELQAYQAQWRWLLKGERNREERMKILSYCARDLSGKMYGNLVSYQEALRLIISA